MRLPHISLIATFLHISAKCAYCILAFSTAILILFVFLLPISIRFRYLDHLIANRIAPSMCLDPCGTRWDSWFQAILYHICAYFCRIFGVYAVHIFLKCHIKPTCLFETARASSCHVAEHRPARSESLQPHTERSSRPGPEPSSVQADVYIWRCTLLNAGS